MLDRQRLTSGFALLGLLLAAAAPAGRAQALEDTEIVPPPSIPAEIRAELRASAAVVAPGEPVWLRFTLTNPTSEPVVLTLPMPDGADALSLPLSAVFGAPAAPALTLAAEGEIPQSVLPPPLPVALRKAVPLGPRGLIGTEIDFREYATAVRYPGAYTIAWRPLGPGGPTATAHVRIEGRKEAFVVTDFGKLQIELAYDGAPRNVENFLELVRQGFYNGLTFHRVVPEFAVSGGCPNADGTGTRPDNKYVPLEATDEPFRTGTVAMAHTQDDPNSASCQFFISLGRYPELDRRYSIIGHCRDDASLQTLRALSDAALDRRFRPLRPIAIRSINLIDLDPRARKPISDAPVMLPPSRRRDLQIPTDTYEPDSRSRQNTDAEQPRFERPRDDGAEMEPVKSPARLPTVQRPASSLPMPQVPQPGAPVASPRPPIGRLQPAVPVTTPMPPRAAPTAGMNPAAPRTAPVAAPRPSSTTGNTMTPISPITRPPAPPLSGIKQSSPVRPANPSSQPAGQMTPIPRTRPPK